MYKNTSTPVPGIAENGEQADSGHAAITNEQLRDPSKHIATVEDAYTHEVHRDDSTNVTAGNISITASGSAEVLYGNMGEGKIETQGSLSVSGKESVYVDSDLHIGKNLNLNSDGEIVLDLSNMGNIGTTPDEKKHHLHDNFLDHFGKDGTGAINVSGGGADGFMIALDMWDYDKNEFDLEKYDINEKDTLAGDINNLQIAGVNGEARDHTFIWVDSAEQLAGIQKYKDANDKEIKEGKTQEATHILEYNFALKDNIDASSIKDYTGIASNNNADDTKEAFTGTFDGRGFAIIGLDVTKDENDDAPVNAGIFGTIGGEGTVKDLNVYSSQFTGQDTAGAIAGRNEGTINGVTTLGDTVKVTGEKASTQVMKGHGTTDGNAGDYITVGAAGGLVGVNAGVITNSNVSDTVIASENDKNNMTVAGGITGINYGSSAIIGDFSGFFDPNGKAPDVLSTSAVITDTLYSGNHNNKHGLGGIAGINQSTIVSAAAFGATNGSYGAFDNPSNEYVGGIAGINYMYIMRAYNESTVIGSSNVGGIAGRNDSYVGLMGTTEIDPGTINNSVNGGSVTALAGMLDASDENTPEYAGGIAGSNYGTIYYGRNTGVVTGTNSVGGIVGLNAEGAGIENISNAIAAEITGEKYVGGIAGTNKGEITAESNLVNEGKIKGVLNVGGIAGKNEASGVISGGTHESGAELTNRAEIFGTQNVGGIAGENLGRITNTNVESKITAVAITDEKGNVLEAPTYFGGVTGRNAGTIENATNTANVEVTEGKFVGGITGLNDKGGRFEGELVNTGNIEGYSNVGGIAGENKEDGVLVGTVDERLVVSNSGTVTATNGGAAGIFHTNSGKIENADISNSGTINGRGDTGTGEDTGGLFGENKGDIINSNLTNSGSVTGGKNTGGLIGSNEGTTITGSTLTNIGYVEGDENTGGLIGVNSGEKVTGSTLTNSGTISGMANTGGLIGVNSAEISESSLINTIKASVKGNDNTGGLIGHNTQTGSVTGGRNEAGTMYEHKIYNNGVVDTDRQGDNVGGLIGNNEGTLSAGYNTGRVSGVSNVGGIAGTNSGKISEVFNTIMTGEETGNRVSGAGNVGGLVGNNSGTLTDAYNTTAVNSQGTNGNAVGSNEGDVTNVYATNTSGKLIGGGSGTAEKVYTFSKDDNSAKLISGGAQNQSGSYDGFFGFDSAWKNYDYWTTPMLKVFLTKGEYKDGVVTAADGLAAFGNANSLIVFVPDPATGGMFMTVYSSQIASSLNPDGTFNPNNLGYDLEGFSVYMGINNGHLHSDGWDRLRNFRERKAELYFHEGGMEYAEEM